jgi:hypothetical protein
LPERFSFKDLPMHTRSIELVPGSAAFAAFVNPYSVF